MTEEIGKKILEKLEQIRLELEKQNTYHHHWYVPQYPQAPTVPPQLYPWPQWPYLTTGGWT